MAYPSSSSIADSRPQNIYDDPEFFVGYKQLRQNDTGLNGALEVPALRHRLPNLRKKKILDLGCGFGDFARYARESGAAFVTTVDISEKMLNEASRLTNDSNIAYQHCAIEDYSPKANSFDVVVSSMALHYVADYRAVVQRVFNTLRPGGHFVFSVEHPVCTANPIGWILDDQEREQYWPLDCYQEEGWRSTKWFIDGVRKFHRTVSQYANTLIEAGFVLDCVDEPLPTEDALTERPEMRIHCRRPPILVLTCHSV